MAWPGDGIVIGGAYAISPYGILPVFGWEIKIDPIEHDVQEAAEVTNLNFHTGHPPAVLHVDDLPGPVAI